MLKVRIIPTLLFKDYGLVKGVGFDSWRRVDTALPAIKVYNTRQVDELVFLDIVATSEGHTIDYEEIDMLADECFMPMTVGGGVRTVEDIRKLLRAGADKVCINTAAVQDPKLISEAAAMFGAQCIVISIDARKRREGGYEVYTHSGTKPEGLSPSDWAKEAEARGAGEIILTSTERDGTMEGYDLDLIRSVTRSVTIPVIASSGAGNYDHMVDAISKAKASAVAAASIFHFTEQTPMEAKQFLAAKGIPTRL